MTYVEIESLLKDLNKLVTEGKLIDAFDKHYHDDVTMQENNLPATVTKLANRQREIEFVNNIVEFRGAVVKDMGVCGDLSYVVWQFDYTHKEWGSRNYSQVSVQQWKDGKIIKEIFIYNN